MASLQTRGSRLAFSACPPARISPKIAPLRHIPLPKHDLTEGTSVSATEDTVRCKHCSREIHLEAGRLPPGIHCPGCGHTFRLGASRRPAKLNRVVPNRCSTPLQEPSGTALTLRSDLVIQEVEEEGTTYFVVKDPVQQRFFRVKALEHFLDYTIRRSDNLRRSTGVALRTLHKVLVGPEVLGRFARKFVDLGLLVDQNRSAVGEHFAPPADGQRAEAGGRGFLFLKLPLVHPEKFLDWLYPKSQVVPDAPDSSSVMIVTGRRRIQRRVFEPRKLGF